MNFSCCISGGCRSCSEFHTFVESFGVCKKPLEHLWVAVIYSLKETCLLTTISSVGRHGPRIVELMWPSASVTMPGRCMWSVGDAGEYVSSSTVVDYDDDDLWFMMMVMIYDRQGLTMTTALSILLVIVSFLIDHWSHIAHLDRRIGLYQKCMVLHNSRILQVVHCKKIG